jgi:hypothetical protein
MSRCTLHGTGRLLVAQPWYQCATCRIVGDRGFCAVCKDTCHAGHDVSGGDYVEAFCMCEACERPAPHCTFFETRRDRVRQEAWICRSCGDLGTICKHCAEHCHSGHVTEAAGVQSFSCDCGKKCTITKSTRTASPGELAGLEALDDILGLEELEPEGMPPVHLLRRRAHRAPVGRLPPHRVQPPPRGRRPAEARPIVLPRPVRGPARP